jgi:hypothetical protein
MHFEYDHTIDWDDHLESVCGTWLQHSKVRNREGDWKVINSTDVPNLGSVFRIVAGDTRLFVVRFTFFRTQCVEHFL